MKEKIDNLQIIKNHYGIALKLINSNQESKARSELFNKMDGDLYDKSLDILDNRNLKVKEKKLKSLIDEVHNKLSTKEDEENEDDLQTDNFGKVV